MQLETPNIVHVVGLLAVCRCRRSGRKRTGNAGRLYTDAVPELDSVWLNVPRRISTTRGSGARSTTPSTGARWSTGGPDWPNPTCQLLPPGFPNYRPRVRYTLHPSPGGRWAPASNGRGAHRAVRDQAHRASGSTARSAPWGATSRFSLLSELGYPQLARLRRTCGHSSQRRRGVAAAADGHRRLDRGARRFRRISHHRSDARRASSTCPRFCDRSSRIEAALAARGRRADALWRDVYRDIEAASPVVPLVNRRTVTLVSKRISNCPALVDDVARAAMGPLTSTAVDPPHPRQTASPSRPASHSPQKHVSGCSTCAKPAAHSALSRSIRVGTSSVDRTHAPARSFFRTETSVD